MRRALLLTILLLAPLLAGTSASAAVSTNDGSWTWQNPIPQGNNLLALSCPAPQLCVAVGPASTVLRTSDGGATWAGPGLNQLGNLAGLACPSAARCYAVDSASTALFTSQNGGLSWSRQEIAASLSALACFSLNGCVGVGLQGHVAYTVDGQAWTQAAAPTTNNLDGVACQPGGVCYAVGEQGGIFRSDDGGAHWNAQSSGTVATLHAVSCWDASHCLAAGDQTIRGTANGLTWDVRDLPVVDSSFAVSCPAANTCVATGQAAFYQTTDAGTNWNVTASTVSALPAAVVCWASTACLAVGFNGTVWNTTDGTTWTLLTTGRLQDDLLAISCPGVSTCFAVGDGESYARTSNGTDWSFSPPVDPVNRPWLNGISCPTPSFCIAAGNLVAGAAVIRRTVDGGATWTAPASAGTAALAAVSCATVSMCVAVGDLGSIVTTGNGGDTWTVRSSGTANRLSGVSCPAADACLAVGGLGIALSSTDGGTTWAPATVAGGPDLTSVACPAAGACIAASAQDIYLTSTLGASWSAALAGIFGTKSVSCFSVLNCVAASGQSDVATSSDGGHTWSSEFVGAAGHMRAVAAVAPARAWTVGEAAAVLTFAGRAARSQVSISPYRVADTRQGLGGITTLQANSSVTVQVAGTGGPAGVPAGAAAAALNVTVTNPTAFSYVTVYPGADLPVASTVNFAPWQTRSNLALVGLNADGTVKLYNSAGTVDVILDAGAFVPGSASPGATSLFEPVAPLRLLDTRGITGGHPSRLGPNQTLDLAVTGAGSIPAAGVSSVVLNLTAVNGTSPSYLTVFPAGGSVPPLATSLSFPAFANVANRVSVKLGAAGHVTIYNSEGAVDVVVDAGGYYTDGSDRSLQGGLLHPLRPTRILDTRPATQVGPSFTPLGPQETRVVAVAGVAGVPATGARSVVLNMTVTNPTAGSFLTAFPGAAPPLASDLNFGPSDTIPNLVVVQLDAGGSIRIYNDQGSTDVLADVVGWY